MHAEAFEDERFDTEIRSRHDAGLALTGDDVGTPIIAMDTPGGRQGIFGPVIIGRPEFRRFPAALGWHGHADEHRWVLGTQASPHARP